MRRAALYLELALIATLGAGACREQKPSTAPPPAPVSPPGSPQGSGAQGAAFGATATGGGQREHEDMTPRLSVPQVAEALSDAFSSAAQAIRPSVVRIDVEISRPGRGGLALGDDDQPDQPAVPDFLRRFFNPGRGGGGAPPFAQPPVPQRGTGSGVVLDAAGDIITNAHVVAKAGKVTITFVDGQKIDGKVVGTDQLTDIAVVRLAKKPDKLTFARVGNSDQLKVGQWVLAVGSPLGLDQSVTAGIVSGLGTGHSRMRVSQRARGYIQTDASINPGNSGGPLVSLAGEVVGINTMINVGPGGAYGYAIPVNQVAQVGQTLIKEGRMRYPYLGVNIVGIGDLPDEERAKHDNLPPEGALVASVQPGSPADEAGLKPGDIIVKIDDHKVAEAADVVDYVGSRTIGSKVKVESLRDGKPRAVDVSLREMPTEGGPAGGSVGVALQTLTEPLARSLGLPPGIKGGAVVAEVQPDSPADRAGLRPGDVIVEVDRKPVPTSDAAAAALHAPGPGGKNEHLLRVVGPNGARFVTVSP